MFLRHLSMTVALVVTLAALTACQSDRLDSDGQIAGIQADLVAHGGDRVFFAAGQSALDDQARVVVEGWAEWLAQHSTAIVTIEGHTDAPGSESANLELSRLRAAATAEYLVSLGVSADRISTASFGEDQPHVYGSDADAYAQNRRAVMAVH